MQQTYTGRQGIRAASGGNILSRGPIENDTPEHGAVRARAVNINSKEEDGEQRDPPFIQTEMNWAMKSFNSKKAPGSDGITADICTNAM